MLTRVLFVLVLITGLTAAFGLVTPMLEEAAAESSAQEDIKLLAFGVTVHEITAEELEKSTPLPVPHFNTPAMAYVWLANLKKGDVVKIALKGGDAVVARNEETLEADKPTFLLLAGKRGVPPGGWPEGTYHAEAEILRDGKPVMSESTKPIVFD
jgi:hypothetical protein